MKRNKSAILLALVLLGSAAAVPAQNPHRGKVTHHVDSVMVNFRQSKWDLDTTVGDNAASLRGIKDRLTTVFNDSVYRLRNVNIYGGASPEGSVQINKTLSERRARTLFDWFDSQNQFSDYQRSFTFYGRDWAGILRLAEKDNNLPFGDETLALLRTIVSEKQAAGGREPARSLERLKQLKGGVPYRYLLTNIFPAVRASKIIIDYEKVLAPDHTPPTVIVHDTVFVERVVEIRDTVFIETCPQRPFYMDVRTNMLYDALALPNVGVEFYLGSNLSLGANWMYGWWKCDHRHRYWRAYGGEIFGRWWFGRKAHEKPLTGHHLGVYGQLYTYDFEWGGEGEMGGKPGGNLWDRNLWGVGLEYGYSLPVAKRINIDFSLGVGYTTGQYHKYKPVDDHYVWQSTHCRHYFGPTKLEIAFVWLIGHDNVNQKKGGMR